MEQIAPANLIRIYSCYPRDAGFRARAARPFCVDTRDGKMPSPRPLRPLGSLSLFTYPTMSAKTR